MSSPATDTQFFESSNAERAARRGAFMATVAKVLLGDDARHRIRLQRTLLAGLLYATYTTCAALGMLGGFVSPTAMLATTVYNGVGYALLYALLRSGVTRQAPDPALTFWQILHALGAIVLIYALIPVGRTLSMPMLSLVLTFGLYRLTPRQTLICGVATVGMLASVLVYLNHRHAAQVEMQRETINVLMAALTLPIFISVSRQVVHIRARLLEQKDQLAEAIEALRAQATRDTLTGLPNRRSMNARLLEEELRFRRHRRPFCVVMFDIDHFKHVNDDFGHLEGDGVLKSFAQLALQHFPAPDQVARWGGEEFVALIPESDLEAALAAVERMRDDAHIEVEDRHRPARRVTFSAGVAQSRPDESISELLKRADMALYESKQAGRDRVMGALS